MLTAFVGQIRMASGDVEGASTLFADALDLARSNGELYFEAEILRLTAEALLAHPRPISPEPRPASPRRWRSRATRRRGSGSCAPLSASPACGRAGKPREAHDLLGPVYSWFTEGFDTPDLRDASLLLAALRE